MKNSINILIALLIIIFQVSMLNAQTQFVASGGNLVISDNYFVLENTKFINNSGSTFQSGNGTTIISGEATNANSEISGSSPTTFYNLEINKTTNGAQLGNNITISNQLILTNGNIDVQTHDLTIENTGTISGGSADSYIQTSSSGALIQEVGASNVTFPIGNSSYTPIVLNNAGTIDNFNARVENTVYENGTNGNTITTDVVNATWHIDEAASGGSDVTATFQWNISDELTDFDRTQAFISNYDNNQWNNGTTQAATGNNPYTLTINGVTNLSSFIVASDASVLPVELLYFIGEKVDEGVLLSWETATEINNSHFDVEWSTDGFTFEKIGKVAGAGTTTEPQYYTFLHDLRRDVAVQRLTQTQPQTQHYYRLKQVDFDGTFEYTDIINIEYQISNKEYRIYPNPATDYIIIDGMSVGEVVQIYNVHGQLVKEFEIQGTNNKEQITNLPSSTYFVKMGTQVKKIIISK